MNVEILTKEDLQAFRAQLLNDIKELFAAKGKAPEKVWLKSSEVRKILKISYNTLQNLRITGKLHPAKLGGIFYYSQEEINALLGQFYNNKHG
ncbi:helix-turn-helix domain-containing protein [Flavisolibacter sp. BT320]|nr:helix-turn-helix domain-containing protein [Flavisolibacter longurius]